MIIDFIYIAIGIGLLTLGGDWLVNGATALARRLSIPPMIIGLTIVAMGTSMPEFAVAVIAAMGGSSGVSVGNVVGSNIANIALILGFTALMRPISAERNLVKKEIPMMIGFAVLLAVFAFNKSIDMIDGAILSSCYVLFLWYCVRTARKNKVDADKASCDAEQHDEHLPLWRDIVNIAIGCVALVGGGKATVVGAVSVAESFGISQTVIGLSVVAIGTSLPELAASIAAARKGATELIIGNVIGSNIANVGCVMGLTTIISPVSITADYDSVMFIDIPVMLVLSVLLIPIVFTQSKIGRKEGAFLLISFFVYMGYLGLVRTG